MRLTSGRLLAMQDTSLRLRDAATAAVVTLISPSATNNAATDGGGAGFFLERKGLMVGPVCQGLELRDCRAGARFQVGAAAPVADMGMHARAAQMGCLGDLPPGPGELFLAPCSWWWVPPKDRLLTGMALPSGTQAVWPTVLCGP